MLEFFVRLSVYVLGAEVQFLGVSTFKLVLVVEWLRVRRTMLATVVHHDVLLTVEMQVLDQRLLLGRV